MVKKKGLLAVENIQPLWLLIPDVLLQLLVG
jgi:hypothetical protein